MYSYNCIVCGDVRRFKSKKLLEKSFILHAKCAKCYKKNWLSTQTRKTRVCPVCGVTVCYNSYSAFIQARIRNSLCESCNLNRFKGESNPFYGKKHSDEVKSLFKTQRAGVPKSEEFKKKISEIKKRKPSGGDPYKFWVDKYGKEIADEKILSVNIKKARKGSDNGMFGKPSPKGSGNGWSGWYKGWFFRSLRELYCVVFILEKNNLSWVSAETDLYSVSYTDWCGNVRNYYPDFVVESTYVIEVKPKRLFNSVNIISKFDAATKHFNNIGMIYIMLDCPVVPLDYLERLIESKDVILTANTFKKYEKWREKVNSTNTAGVQRIG